jgi:thiol:disulfide interchange protein DsbD
VKAARRLSLLIVFAALVLVPSVALADGSDSKLFKEILEKHGVVVAVLASFGFGVVASLTPCVYPMVPITVSIFGATEAKSRARAMALSGMFVLGIAALFTPLIVLSALSGTLMGSALSNPWVVSGIAVLFTALAASMFGAFEIALPSSWTNRLSTVGGVGYKGAFVIGMAMGLIAAPCTGPFLTGMMAWIASTRDVVLGSAAGFAFSLGLGVLFFMAGSFAVSLPKGGAWMLGIKWVSGVALAYMALAYMRDSFPFVRQLARSDTTYGVIALLVLLVGLGLGTVHVLAERRKSPFAHLSKPMKLLSILPAVAGAFMFISWWNISNFSLESTAQACLAAPPIDWQKDEEAARAKAAAEKKPFLVDFGATWCKACNELDEQTWPVPCVRAEAQRFVAVKVDATDDDAPETKRLQKKYDVVGLPTVVVLGSDGAEQARFNEFVKPEAMVKALKDVK